MKIGSNEVAKQTNTQDRPPKDVRRINATSMAKLRFRDFRSLRVPGGRDRFTNLRGEALRASISPEQLAAIVERISEPRYQDTACRWIHRGLETDRAIRKALTDWEVANNAIGGRRGAYEEFSVDK